MENGKWEEVLIENKKDGRIYHYKYIKKTGNSKYYKRILKKRIGKFKKKLPK